jgi:hypothetical protein
MPAVASSAIAAIDHLARERTLVVTFTSGRRYAYAGVSAGTYRAFLKAASKGGYFNDHIREAYPMAELR